MYWICASAIAAGLCLGRSSFASAFKLVSSCSFTLSRWNIYNEVLTDTVVELVEPEFTNICFSCTVFVVEIVFSRSATKYLLLHLFHAFSLHRFTYLSLVVHSYELSSALEFFVLTSLPRNILFDVNTFNWMSSST